jgi:hypothetical protein
MTLTRHLLPDEFDLLVDGETGFGVRELRGHLTACPQCSAEFEALRAFTAEIEALPAWAPRADFSARVMGQVHVFEPWHVAVRNVAVRVWPERPVTRVLAGAAALTSTGMVTAGTVWAWTRRDDLLLGSVARERALGVLTATAASISDALVGSAPLTSSPVIIALAGVSLVTLSAAAGVYGLRAIAARARNAEG